MKIMKHLLLILVGGILLNACSDDREMDDGRWKASALRVPLEVSSAVIRTGIQKIPPTRINNKCFIIFIF